MEAARAYFRGCRELISAVERQEEEIEAASELFADTIARGRLVHLFGSGHSRILVEEMWPRYGSFPGFHPIVERFDVAVGVVDVKSYYIETAEDVSHHVRRCQQHAPPERPCLAPDCGLSQTARWAARKKLHSPVEGTRRVREELGR